jgi:nucleotide-binding universal stress UspA family protein
MSEELTVDVHDVDQTAVHYLIAIDGSGPSDAALKWGLQRAEQYGADVLLAHVQGSRSRGAGDVVLDAAVAVAARSHPTVRVSARSITGDVANELAAEAVACDLLVLGTHKTGYLRGRTIGSRGLIIATLAPCSVAIIPNVSLIGRHGVVVGMDPRNGSRIALNAAALEADRLRQTLILLTSDEQSAPPTSLRLNEAISPGRSALGIAADHAIATVPDLEVHSRLSSRVASEALLDASRTASLLVLGASAAGDPSQPLIGPVTHDVLMNINAPVLIARANSVTRRRMPALPFAEVRQS